MTDFQDGSLPPVPLQTTAMVRTTCPSSKIDREKVLRQVEYNIFAFPAGLVICDFLSDSGTSAMTNIQWAALMLGDESYGRNSGYYCLLDAFRDIFERGNQQERLFEKFLSGSVDPSIFETRCLKSYTGGFVNGGTAQLSRPNFFIVPQGRCAEALLFGAMRESLIYTDSRASNPIIVSNGFFDTTGANAQMAGFETHAFTAPGLQEPFDASLIDTVNHFKGNLDIEAVKTFLEKNHARVSLILMTITNNFAAGQPVSMANIKSAALLAKEYDVPLFFDACRFAENARFIQEFEEGYKKQSMQTIIQEMFSYVDGFTISLKKDGLANMGGALAFRDDGVFTRKFSHDGPVGVRLKERQILSYGNDSYGGMSGRDLMAAAVGLYETTKETFLRSRIGQVRTLAKKLHGADVPILLPPGGHAIYIDMDRFFDGSRHPAEFASVGFTIKLLAQYGIRAAEAGPFAWEWDKKTTDLERSSIPNLVRFAVPRNSLTDSHIEYTVAAIAQLRRDRDTIPSVRITRGQELRIRHFQCGFDLVPAQTETVHDCTFLSKAVNQLEGLGKALKIPAKSYNMLEDGLRLSMTGWGHKVIPKKPLGRLSGVGLDHSPIEYSIAIEHEKENSQLRFLVEAQPCSPFEPPGAFQKSALQLNEDLQSDNTRGVSLERLKKVQDLFVSDTMGYDSFTAWHSSAVSSTGEAGPEWKIYLNPCGHGDKEPTHVIEDAFCRLDLESSFRSLKLVLGKEDKFIYFSLDLNDGPKSRVKVYVQHPNATAAEIADKIALLCPDTQPEEIQNFCAAMGGDSFGPYAEKPLLTCFAFTAEGSTPEVTVHFPVSAYAKDDKEIQTRIERHFSGKSPLIFSAYQESVRAIAARPLEERKGLHSWVSLKQTHCRGLVTTFYLSADFFGKI